MTRSRLTLAIAMAGALFLLASAAFAGPTTVGPRLPSKSPRSPKVAQASRLWPFRLQHRGAVRLDSRLLAPTNSRNSITPSPPPPRLRTCSRPPMSSPRPVISPVTARRSSKSSPLTPMPKKPASLWASSPTSTPPSATPPTWPTFSIQLAANSDPETQAFAVMCRTANPAQRASQWEVYQKTLTDFIAQWKGTPSAGRPPSPWRSLPLTSLNYPQAIATFRGVSHDYAGTLVGEEALVALAETLDWSVPSHLEEAQSAFERPHHRPLPRPPSPLPDRPGRSAHQAACPRPGPSGPHPTDSDLPLPSLRSPRPCPAFLRRRVPRQLGPLR